MAEHTTEKVDWAVGEVVGGKFRYHKGGYPGRDARRRRT